LARTAPRAAAMPVMAVIQVWVWGEGVGVSMESLGVWELRSLGVWESERGSLTTDCTDNADGNKKFKSFGGLGVWEGKEFLTAKYAKHANGEKHFKPLMGFPSLPRDGCPSN
jgi:hypothetical protein